MHPTRSCIGHPQIEHSNWDVYPGSKGHKVSSVIMVVHHQVTLTLYNEYPCTETGAADKDKAIREAPKTAPERQTYADDRAETGVASNS